MNQCKANKFNKQIEGFYSQFYTRDIRSDIAEWLRVTSNVELSSSLIFMAVQRPGKGLQNLTIECKSKTATCFDCTGVISKVMKECGALDFDTEILGDRIRFTTDNHVRITMVLQ